LAIAVYGLWRTELRPFRLGILASDPRFRVFTVRSEEAGETPGREWYIPSIDLSLTVWNNGTQPGVLEDVRILVTTTPEDGGPEHDTYVPHSIVDYPSFERANGRFESLATVTSDFFGVPVVERSPRTFHLMLEAAPGRWDEKREPFDVTAELQVRSTERVGWRTVGRYGFPGVDPFDGSGFILGRLDRTPPPLEPHMAARIEKWLSTQGDRAPTKRTEDDAGALDDGGAKR